MRSYSTPFRRTFLACGAALGVALVIASCSGEDSAPPQGFAGTDGGGGEVTAGSAGADASAAGTPNAGGEGGAGGGAFAGGGQGGEPIPDTCGNGTVEEGEQCDDGDQDPDNGCRNSCRFTCVIDNDCTDGAFCNGTERCTEDHTCIAGTPVPDNWFCGQNSICKNGVCTPGTAVCGDGLIIAPENCEDGVTLGDAPGDGDGCDTDCRYSCSTALGGRQCVADECAGVPACDESTHTCTPGTPILDYTPCGTAGSNAKCVNQVCRTQYCSNGITDGSEQCDDGNLVSGDGCDSDCLYTCTALDSSRCNPPDECRISGGCTIDNKCLPPVSNDNAPCGTGSDVCIKAACRPSMCGDGVVSAGEECDDLNQASGDGCDVDCQFECEDPAADCGAPPPCAAWTCVAGACVADFNPSCGDGGPCTVGACSETCVAGACTADSCGGLLGVPDPGEQCDRGPFNGSAGGGCTVNCRYQCQTDTDCNGDDPCLEDVHCEDVMDGATLIGRTCAGQATPDGTSCGTDRICVAGGCRVGFCGDGYADESQGEECDPPGTACDLSCKALVTCDMNGPSNNDVWALKMTIGVTWPRVANPIEASQTIILAGTGTISSWARVVLTQPSPTDVALGMSVKPCGLTIPDFQTSSDTGFNINDETYGLTIPNSLFDSGSVAAATGDAAGNSPGSAFTADATSVLIGLTMTNPFGPWSTLQTGTMPGATFVDADNDTSPGVTALVKTGGSYDYVAVNPIPSEPIRADQLHLILRQIASLSGTINTCDDIAGVASVSQINSHVVGCRVTDGAPCDDLARDLTDASRPQYVANSATFQMVRISGNQATCPQVRATIP
jgi:cysteine-rich repeat protein